MQHPQRPKRRTRFPTAATHKPYSKADFTVGERGDMSFIFLSCIRSRLKRLQRQKSGICKRVSCIAITPISPKQNANAAISIILLARMDTNTAA
jgi:hypothetical protein